MIATQINVADASRPALHGAQAYLASPAARNTVGRAVSNLMRGHFGELEADRPNALGGARTHYWSDARRGTHYVVQGDDVLVGTDQPGVRLHYLGGTVLPGVGPYSRPSYLTGKPAKYLTIPARAEAHGRRASEFDDLIVLWGRSGPYALARAVSTMIAFSQNADWRAGDTVTGKRKFLTTKARGEQGGEVLFWLVKRADFDPDPTVLPTEAQIQDTATSALSSELVRRFGAQATGAPGPVNPEPSEP